ncbi:transcriptional regulator, IclR family [Actinobacteria bacterium OK074]|nr:transcriptional regulator, IclR family [Actinobacteria bacterium OK074]
MPGPIQSLSRAAAVLRLLATGRRQFGLTDTATSLGLSKATAYGILRTLEDEGLVERHPVSGKYQLGPELLRLGRSYLTTHEVRTHARAWLDDLARATGEAVRLGVRHRAGVLILHHVARPNSPRGLSETGTVLSSGETALGTVLEAYDDLPLAPPDPDGSLELARSRGWFCALAPERHGLASLAAPIHDGRQVAVGAVEITGAAERVLEDGTVRGPLVAAIRGCARAISQDLGDERR